MRLPPYNCLQRVPGVICEALFSQLVAEGLASGLDLITRDGSCSHLTGPQRYVSCTGTRPATGTPDNQGLLGVALRGEGDDVVTAAQLCKGMTLGVALELHASSACLAVHHTCSSDAILRQRPADNPLDQPGPYEEHGTRIMRAHEVPGTSHTPHQYLSCPGV